jgi:beta-N-acetylhexosaminidase
VSAACILGVSGLELTAEERAFFAELRPWGFILFKRNIESPDQVRRLTDSFRELLGRDDVPVLIDQEGGRVQRMGPPHWPKYPSGRAYGEAPAGDPLTRRELTRLGARLMAADLRAVGINVDCVPVLDVPQPGAHAIVGDRAYADDPDTIAVLGRAAAEGLIAGGVLPVIKHMPGHGRAFADSHHDLPVVDAPRPELSGVDFTPFRALSDMPMGMTAHVVYTAVDRKRPGTTSRKVIREVIRQDIGFDGLLMTDDLSMKALSGGFTERAEAALAAGCDVVLHCNGDMDEMQAVAKGVGKLRGAAKRRAGAAMARLARTPEPLDEPAARARFAGAFAPGAGTTPEGPRVGE